MLAHSAPFWCNLGLDLALSLWYTLSMTLNELRAWVKAEQEEALKRSHIEGISLLDEAPYTSDHIAVAGWGGRYFALREFEATLRLISDAK